MKYIVTPLSSELQKPPLLTEFYGNNNKILTTQKLKLLTPPNKMANVRQKISTVMRPINPTTISSSLPSIVTLQNKHHYGPLVSRRLILPSLTLSLTSKAIGSKKPASYQIQTPSKPNSKRISLVSKFQNKDILMLE